MNIFQNIDRVNAELQKLLSLKQEYQQSLDKKFRLEFNYNSNHLEGNTLTYNETQLLLLFGKTVGKHELRELEEMKFHDVAYDMIKEWASDTEWPLNENTIKHLNEVLLVRPFWKEAITPDGQSVRREIKVGDYKKHPNHVRLQNGEIFQYATPEETPMLMGDLVDWYRTAEEERTLHPVELAAQLHYRFVRIHPFDDGNGRISRLLMNYVLLKHQLPPVIIKSAKKKDYLFALNQADAGDTQAFVQYIAQQLIWSLELSIKAANGESLEEEDDLEKEIAIWKKNFNAQPDVVLKSFSVINERYEDSIRPLFKLFIEKHQSFSDLFSETQIMSFSNYGRKRYVELRDLALYLLDHKIEHDKWLNGLESNDLKIDDLDLVIHFINFKKAGTNNFNYTTNIACKFYETEWLITSGQTKIQILYNQTITDTERQDFIKNAIKETFISVQEKAES